MVQTNVWINICNRTFTNIWIHSNIWIVFTLRKRMPDIFVSNKSIRMDLQINICITNSWISEYSNNLSHSAPNWKPYWTVIRHSLFPCGPILLHDSTPHNSRQDPHIVEWVCWILGSIIHSWLEKPATALWTNLSLPHLPTMQQLNKQTNICQQCNNQTNKQTNICQQCNNQTNKQLSAINATSQLR